MTSKEEPVSAGFEMVATRARAWLARLQDDDVSGDEISEWQAWLAEDETHKIAYEEVERLWALAGQANLSALEPTLPELVSDAYRGEQCVSDWISAESKQSAAVVESPGRYQKLPVWAALAASLLVILAALFVLPRYGSESPASTGQLVASISTKKAEHRTAKLFDGSAIDVGAASNVAIDFTGSERVVELSEGEAFFDVTSDPDRPFVVKTSLGDVTAVGTAFNVRLASDRLVVTVTEGKVDVLGARAGDVGKSEKIRIKAGSMLSLPTGNSDVAKPALVPAPPVSWREGRFTYRSEPLRYVVADINRYSDVRIEITDDIAAELIYSGTMRPESVEEWADALQTVFLIDVERRPGNVIRIRARS